MIKISERFHFLFLGLTHSIEEFLRLSFEIPEGSTLETRLSSTKCVSPKFFVLLGYYVWIIA